MKPFLLDVNVIVALLWRANVHHRAARAWFKANKAAGIRTCPLTEAGAARILGNPKRTAEWMTLGTAFQMLNEVLIQPEHAFWPLDIPLPAAIAEVGQLTGHQQVNDAYLIALAKSRGGILATFDRGVLALQGAGPYVELITG